MFTIIAQKTTTLGSAATTSRIIERKKGRASSLIIARAEPAKPKLQKAVSLFFVRNENFWMCAIETNAARDFLSLSLSFNQNRRILRLVVAVREGTATSRRLRTRSKSAKVRVLEKKKKMIRSVFVSQIRVIILCVASLF